MPEFDEKQLPDRELLEWNVAFAELLKSIIPPEQRMVVKIFDNESDDSEDTVSFHSALGYLVTDIITV